MASLRCVRCQLGLPPDEYHHTSKCPLCGHSLVFSGFLPPSTDWVERVESPEAVMERNAVAQIVEYSGMYWVAHKPLIDAGFTHLCNFDVVRVNGRYWELQGHVGKQVSSLPGGAWWVEEIDPDAEQLDIPVQSGEA